jgi:antitoxin ParD1/3/4
MIDYRFTPEAEDDLFEIWCYIARDSVPAANQVESAVYQACVFLAKEPWSGSTRKDVTALGVRFWTVQQYPNYVVVYRPETQPLEILRVLHGMRNLKSVLGGRARIL